jgi:beta-mannosidase
MRSGESSAPVIPAPGRVRVESHQRQNLTEGWELASCRPDACADPAEADGLAWSPAVVPGTAAEALRRAGGWEHGDQLDFDAEDWWFRSEFEAEPAAPGEKVLLRLDGVATVYEVFLNGIRVGAGSSMFAAAAIDIGERLRGGRNQLAIRCRALAGQLGAKRKPRARWRTRVADNRLRFWRTMLLGRCPGFAPGPAAVGPWRPVWIERRRRLEVTALALRARVEGEDGVLAVSLRARSLDGAAIEAAAIEVSGAGSVEGPLAISGDNGSFFELVGELRVPRVRRWWPHTHGEPALYQVQIRLFGADEAIEIDAGRVGFRQIAAGPEPDHDVLADGIDLRVNGVAVFARGAVWTPDDFVGMAPDRDRLRAALERLRAVGMNMVRIPGIGAYESSDFHDLCDELGLMVWQDFMFANFDYPFTDAEFRGQVEQEVAEQLAALGGRASLVILCGSSEVEQQVAMLGLDPALGHDQVFVELLPTAAREDGIDAIYVRSAPSGGARPFLPACGVANYYGVGGYRRPLTDARLAEVKFAAECLAFANVPDEAGVEAILPGAATDVVVHHPRWKSGVPRDAGSGWDFDDVRDHYLRELFGVDPEELRRYDHERYLDLSRAVSGEAMKAVFGEWRRAGSPCGGGLVLWSRDLMPGAGWGLVDWSGNPKPALLALRPILGSTAVWFTDEGLAGVGVHVANDSATPLRGTLRLLLYADLRLLVGEAETAVELDPHDSVSLDLETILGRFVDASWAYHFGPPAQDLIVASLEIAGAPVADAFWFPAGLPGQVSSAEELGFVATAEQGPEGIELSLAGDRLVFGLRVTAAGLSTEDVPASLAPGSRRKVLLRRLPGHEAVGPITISALNLRGRTSTQVPA